MILDILCAFLMQVVSTVGVIVVFGLLIALCNRLFYSNMGIFGTTACYVTGFIGTPVHELSHALFCVVFCHKITEIRLFQINSADGTLGYVSHSYSPKNVYQKIGNFFIGIAPILVISGVLYLLCRLLLPNFVTLIIAQTADFQLSEGIGSMAEEFFFLITCFLSEAVTLNWWIFLLLSVFLALHMTLSTADLKGAWNGLAILLTLTFGADVILGLLTEELLDGFTGICMAIGQFLSGFMMLSLFVSLLAVALSFFFKLIVRKRI